jgi:hypothetical protein
LLHGLVRTVQQRQRDTKKVIKKRGVSE